MTNLRKSAALRLTTHHTSRLFTIPLYCHNWLIVDPFLLIPCRHACPHAIIIWHTPARPYVSRCSLAKSSLCNLCWRLHTRSGSSLASTVTRRIHASEKPHLHPILSFHYNSSNSISLVHLLEASDVPTTPPYTHDTFTRPNAYGLLKTPFHYHARGEYSFPRGMTHLLYSVTNHIQVPARNLRSGDSTHLRNRNNSFMVTLRLRPRSPRVRLGSIPCLCHGMNLAPLCPDLRWKVQRIGS